MKHYRKLLIVNRELSRDSKASSTKRQAFLTVSIFFILFTAHCSLFTIAYAMINLGEFKAGTAVFYGANFHNDTGTIENPTSPEAQQRTPAGVWSDLTAPAIQNAKVGFYGGTIDTTGYAVGEYIIRMAGTVATAKTVATVFSFTIVANIEADTYAAVGSPMQAGTKVQLNSSQPDYAPAKAGDAMTLTGDYDAAKTCNPTEPNNTNIGLIKDVTDKILFDGSSFVKSVEQDKTGYSLTQTFPANFADLAITETTGKVTVGTNSDKTGYTIADATSDAVIADAVWNALVASYGIAGSYGAYLENIYANPISLPPMQARIYSAFLIQNQITKIKQGDTPTINFEIDGDWSTWTARFGVKAAVTDTTYKIGPKDCVIGAYDPVTETTSGYVTLTTTDTATAGTKWLGEIELKKAGAVHTLIDYLLTIEPDVIK